MPEQEHQFLVVTGMSGAGRSTVANALEDMGWYVVDNLPPQLIAELAALTARAQPAVTRVAVSVDVRGRSFFSEIADALKAKYGFEPSPQWLRRLQLASLSTGDMAAKCALKDSIRSSRAYLARQLASATAGDAVSQDDAWRRRSEVLFERLAVRWEIAGLPLTEQKMLLGRYRMASADERRWVRETIAGHLERFLPELS